MNIAVILINWFLNNNQINQIQYWITRVSSTEENNSLDWKLSLMYMAIQYLVRSYDTVYSLTISTIVLQPLFYLAAAVP